jgi:VWFA-related protein
LNARVFLFLVVLVLGGTACGQQSPGTPILTNRSAQPSQSTALDLEVIVTDKAGNPEKGLQKSDFSLWDDGNPTDIEAFETSDQTPSQNFPTQIILLVDEVNAPFVMVSAALPQIQNWIDQSHGRLPFPTSLVFLSQYQMNPPTQPTTDGNLLDNELREHRQAVHNLGISSGWPGASERLEISVNGLGHLAQAEARVPGRKLLIWISPGWGLFGRSTIMADSQQRGLFNAAVAISGELADADIVLYAVDPAGQNSWDATAWKSYLKPVRTANQMLAGNLGLQVLATQSGGQFVFGDNDLPGEISACVRNAGTEYMLRFQPQRGKTADTWHELEVKVDRPGLIVRTRYGYYAQP